MELVRGDITLLLERAGWATSAGQAISPTAIAITGRIPIETASDLATQYLRWGTFGRIPPAGENPDRRQDPPANSPALNVPGSGPVRSPASSRSSAAMSS